MTSFMPTSAPVQHISVNYTDKIDQVLSLSYTTRDVSITILSIVGFLLVFTVVVEGTQWVVRERKRRTRQTTRRTPTGQNPLEQTTAVV